MPMNARMEETIKVALRCSELTVSSLPSRAVISAVEPATATNARTTAKRREPAGRTGGAVSCGIASTRAGRCADSPSLATGVRPAMPLLSQSIRGRMSRGADARGKAGEGTAERQKRTEGDAHVEPVQVVALVGIIVLLFSLLLDTRGWHARGAPHAQPARQQTRQRGTPVSRGQFRRRTDMPQYQIRPCVCSAEERGARAREGGTITWQVHIHSGHRPHPCHRHAHTHARTASRGDARHAGLRGVRAVIRRKRWSYPHTPGSGSRPRKPTP